MTPDPWVRRTYSDRCVECLVYVVDPTVASRNGGQASCLYVCPCGATWSCNWSLAAVEGGWDVVSGEDQAA